MTRRGVLARGDEGAGSVLMLVALAVVVVVGTAAVTLAAGASDRQRAQVGADLAALAAAPFALVDPESACARAATIAQAHHVSMERCVVEGDTATVVTTVHGRGVLRPDVHGIARAGPAPVVPDS